MNASSVEKYLRSLQANICASLEGVDGVAKFKSDPWTRQDASGDNKLTGGGGDTRVLTDGVVFERAGVAFSMVQGTQLPPSATAHRPELMGRQWRAMGVSLVIHPLNPHVPTAHANVRFFIAERENEEPVWWFGGGFDLTPYYGYDLDCRHWHSIAAAACAP